RHNLNPIDQPIVSTSASSLRYNRRRSPMKQVSFPARRGEHSMRKFLVLWMLAGVSFAFADDSKISPDLKAKLATQNPTVVVQYNQPPSLLDLQGILNL